MLRPILLNYKGFMPVPKNILIIRLSSIGDIILSYPLIMELNKAYPASQVDFLLAEKYQGLLQPIKQLLNNIYYFNKNNGFVEIKRYRKVIKNREYDWVIDIHNKLRSNLLTLFQNSRIFRIKKYRLRRWLYIQWGLNVYPKIPVYKKYLNTIFQKLNNYSNWHVEDCNNQRIIKNISNDIEFFNQKEPVVIIFPGARHDTKKWPWPRYKALIEAILQATDWRIILAGNQKDGELIAQDEISSPHIINVCGKYNLHELMCLISLCNMVISNDSGPMHIGALFHIPQIAIFGNTVPEFGFKPMNDRALILENNDLNCRPCSHIGYDKCPKNHFKCMLDISIERVYNAFTKLIRLYNLVI